MRITVERSRNRKKPQFSKCWLAACIVISLIFTAASYVLAAFDKTREYIPRSQRQEWAAIGLIGRLIIRDNGKCEPGGYVTARQGVGAPTFKETRARCLRRIDDDHVEILIG